ncbi:MAG: hypothetical protein IPI23_03720 [Bacteroidetes bacterium]|nr:hypothetical protein [Bacteroidota bacterium]
MPAPTIRSLASFTTELSRSLSKVNIDLTQKNNIAGAMFDLNSRFKPAGYSLILVVLH